MNTLQKTSGKRTGRKRRSSIPAGSAAQLPEIGKGENDKAKSLEHELHKPKRPDGVIEVSAEGLSGERRL